MATILIVEDEQTVRESLARSFAAEGCSVFTASDGVEGLRLARERQPDPIVLDLMLPLMDGLSVCRNVRIVLSRDLLLEKVWGYDYLGDSRTVDVHIRWLREKIEADPSAPVRIATIRGVGYRFDS